MSPADIANRHLSNLVAYSIKIIEVLENIENNLQSSKTQPKLGGVVENNTNINSENINNLASSISALVEASQKARPADAENVSKFITTIVESIESLENISKEKVETIALITNALGKVSVDTFKGFAMGAIYAPFAILGAKAYVMIINSIIEGLTQSKANEETLKQAILISNLGNNVIKFGLALSAYTFIAPVALVGATFFGLTLTLLINTIRGGANPENTKAINDILSLGSKIIIFGLSMAAISIISPLVAIGTLTFALSLKAIIFSLTSAKEISKESVGIINKLVISMSVFALAGYFIFEKNIEIATGILTLVLGIAAITLTIKFLASDKSVQIGMLTLSALIVSMSLFSLAGILVYYQLGPFIVGTLSIIIGISALALVMKKLGLEQKMLNMGSNSIETIIKDVFKFSATMVLLSYFDKQFINGILVYSLGISAMLLILGIVTSQAPTIKLADKLLEDILGNAWKFALSMVVLSYFVQQFAIGTLAFTLGILAVSGAMFLIGTMDKTGAVTRGIQSINKISLGFLSFAIGAVLISNFIKESPGEFLEKMATIGLVVGIFAAAALLIGIPPISGFVMTGASVLLILGGSLLLFAGALFLLSKINFYSFDSEAFSNVLKGIADGMLIVGLYSIPIILGSAALLTLSVALLPLSGSLLLFKSIEWTQNDSENLSSTIKSVVKGMTEAFSSIGPIEFAKLFFGASLLALLGLAFTSLAWGLQNMANLTFVEQEWDESQKKLVPKRSIRLTNQDFENAANNIKTIINTLKDPLYEFGKMASDGTFFGLGSGYLMKGITTAATLGDLISKLAKGVADMANLQIVEWEVINQGTPEAKLVPKDSKKLSESDFKNAGENIKTLLETIAEPLIKFGKDAEQSSGLFSGAYMQKGIEAAKGVGDFISNIAKGVADMAVGNVIEYEVINKGTKDAKIVPKDVISLKEKHFTNAGKFIGNLLNALGEPLVTFGKEYAKGSGLFKSGYMEKGIEAISKIGQPIKSLADIVIELAKGSVVQTNEKGEKVGEPKDFLGALGTAETIITKLFNFLPTELEAFGKKLNDNKSLYKVIYENIPKFTNVVENITKMVTDYSNIVKSLEEVEKKNINLGSFLISLADSSKKAINSMQNTKEKDLQILNSFITHIEKLVNIGTNKNSPFDKFIKDLREFGNEIEKFTKIWKTWGKDNSDYWRDYVQNVVNLSKVNSENLLSVSKILSEASINEKVKEENFKSKTIGKSNQESKQEIEKSNFAQANKFEKTGTIKDELYKNKQDNSKDQNLSGKTIATLYVNKLIVKTQE